LRSRRGGGAGFTLIELLAVLAIMMILGGVGIAAYFGMSTGIALGSAVTHLRSTLMLSRQNAMVNGHRTYVVLESDSYVVVQQNGTGEGDGGTLMDEFAEFDEISAGVLVYNLDTGESSPVLSASGSTLSTQRAIWGNKLCRYGWEIQPRVWMPKRIRLGDKGTTNPVNEYVVFNTDGTTRLDEYEFGIFDANKTKPGDPYKLFTVAGLTGFISVKDSSF
jgi:prepilin-type N-terminal cleavage/methylation domain-containing protein